VQHEGTKIPGDVENGVVEKIMYHYNRSLKCRHLSEINTTLNKHTLNVNYYLNMRTILTAIIQKNLSALTLLVGWQEEHLACKKLSGYLPGVRRRFAYAQLMPLPLTISCSSKSRLI